ncbi:MAG: hypothetical protein GY756_07145 [bacterium]|nr:hypothetical protein [bacterium]
MALSYYYNSISTEFKRHYSGFSWDHRNVKISTKSALACVIAVTAAYIMELDLVFYAGMSALVMSEANTGATFRKGLCRIFGTLLGAFLAVFAFGLFQQNHLYFSICILLLCTICYYKRERSEYGYFWYLIIVTFMIIDVESLGLVDTRDMIYVAYNRTYTVLIGIASTFLVHLYLWPFFATNDMVLMHAKMRKKAFRLIKEIFGKYVHGEEVDDDTVSLHYEEFKKRLHEYNKLKTASSVEKRNCKDFFFKLSKETLRLTELIENFILFNNSIKRLKSLKFQKKFSFTFDKINTYLDELYLIIINNNEKKLYKLKLKTDKLFEEFELKYRKKYGSGEHSHYPVADVLMLHESVHLAKEIFELYFSILSVDKLFKDKRVIFTESKKLNKSFTTFQIFGYKSNIHIPSLKYGIRTGISMLAVIWFWWMLELPITQTSGVEIVIAIVTVSYPDEVFGNFRSIQRIIGCCIGAFLGFSFLSLQTTSFVVYLACLFVATFIGAYVKCGREAVTYIGLQISLAYLVATTVDFSQVTNVVDITYRIVGILFGIICSWAVNQIIFREKYLDTIKSQIKDYYEHIRELRLLPENKISKNYEIQELKSISFTLNRLHDLGKIDENGFNILNEWFIQNRRLIYLINEIQNIDNSVLSFVKSINGQYLKNINDLILGFGKNSNSPDKEYEENIQKAIYNIEHIKLNLRKKALMGDADMHFKSMCSHFLMSLKRIIVRLDDIYKLQEKINNSSIGFKVSD